MFNTTKIYTNDRFIRNREPDPSIHIKTPVQELMPTGKYNLLTELAQNLGIAVKGTKKNMSHVKVTASLARGLEGPELPLNNFDQPLTSISETFLATVLNKTFYLVDYKEKNPLAVKRNHPHRLTSIYSSNSHLLVGAVNGNFSLYDLNTVTAVNGHSPTQHSSVSHTLCLEKEFHFVISYQDSTLQLWDARAHAAPQIFARQHHPSTGLAMHNQWQILSLDTNGGLYTWDLRMQTGKPVFALQSDFKSFCSFQDHLVGCTKNQLKTFSFASASICNTLNLPLQPLTMSAIPSQENRILITSWDRDTAIVYYMIDYSVDGKEPSLLTYVTNFSNEQVLDREFVHTRIGPHENFMCTAFPQRELITIFDLSVENPRAPTEEMPSSFDRYVIR